MRDKPALDSKPLFSQFILDKVKSCRESEGPRGDSSAAPNGKVWTATALISTRMTPGVGECRQRASNNRARDFSLSA
ncbi:hypothetical protein SKAU_G00213410 [Synaphobranchus kaupii]|uniref:Uncharacterized protein n=1 Tax=Synaphobranchus kaupii TaxID=118154 RepID=A0A9Q1F9C8_SYNKA|nr:hypothetical protein SKAU_G00213410 [Synaphobranchus kaupii]